jgi:hypothetical protein
MEASYHTNPAELWDFSELLPYDPLAPANPKYPALFGGATPTFSDYS